MPGLATKISLSTVRFGQRRVFFPGMPIRTSFFICKSILHHFFKFVKRCFILATSVVGPQ